MYNKDMYALGSKRSVIRELFEYGKKLAAEKGSEKVYDFSLGNPNVPAPNKVKETILELMNLSDSTGVHGYTSAQGDFGVRSAVCDNINERFNAGLNPDSIYMTAGAAASLCITLKALCSSDDDEFITFAPFFPEYSVFARAAGGTLRVVPVNEEDFAINFYELNKILSPKTKAIIMNSPNNPSGVVYSEKAILSLSDILRIKSMEYGHPIYLISDEPYREIVYNEVKVPFIMNYYDNSVVCYSYSKALSLPGERIGYIAVSPKMEEEREIYLSICGAGRALGYVCAPSMFQFVVKNCIGMTSDINLYKRNRDLIFDTLTEYGYKCIRPDGAFYLFIKALEEDATMFCDRAKKLGLLLVPGDDFGAKGYVRIAYCVNYDMILRSLPAFKKLAESYKV